MNWKTYECGSCAYLVFVEEGTTQPPAKPSHCPMCRSPMYDAPGADTPPDEPTYECGECGYSLRVPEKAMRPYKCAQCNFTFPTTPKRRVQHKL
ncbi:MAG: hypothetical protein ABIH66_09415 [bacterium]